MSNLKKYVIYELRHLKFHHLKINDKFKVGFQIHYLLPNFKLKVLKWPIIYLPDIHKFDWDECFSIAWQFVDKCCTRAAEPNIIIQQIYIAAFFLKNMAVHWSRVHARIIVYSMHVLDQLKFSPRIYVYSM